MCLCVCICIATFIRGVFFCLCRWAATGALCLKVIRGTIFLALCSKEAAAVTTRTNNNRRCKITFGSCASLLQQKRSTSTNTNTTTATTTRDALCKWNDAREGTAKRESKIVEESRFTCTAAVAAAAIESVSLREHLLLLFVVTVVVVVAVTLQARDDAAWF